MTNINSVTKATHPHRGRWPHCCCKDVGDRDSFRSGSWLSYSTLLMEWHTSGHDWGLSSITKAPEITSVTQCVNVLQGVIPVLHTSWWCYLMYCELQNLNHRPCPGSQLPKCSHCQFITKIFWMSGINSKTWSICATTSRPITTFTFTQETPSDIKLIHSKQTDPSILCHNIPKFQIWHSKTKTNQQLYLSQVRRHIEF